MHENQRPSPELLYIWSGNQGTYHAVYLMNNLKLGRFVARNASGGGPSEACPIGAAPKNTASSYASQNRNCSIRLIFRHHIRQLGSAPVCSALRTLSGSRAMTVR